MWNSKRKVVEIDSHIHSKLIDSRGNLDEDFPSDFSERQIDLIRFVKNYSMTSYERLLSMINAVDYIVSANIEGAIVECGVWKGGNMMLAAKILLEKMQEYRKLFLFDTFEGMSNPEDVDVSFNNFKAEDILGKVGSEWCYASLEEVKSNIFSTLYPSENINLIKGKVEDTLQSNEIDKISLLRLDTDWYSSTKVELEVLYPKLVKGGILIIDDYGHWRGARKAVDEYFMENSVKLFLHRIDYTGRIAVKQ